jgi:hypothetical protein
MGVFFYYLVTFLESILAVVGIRSYEEPRYSVVARFDQGVEVRDYAPRVAVETDRGGGQGDGAAFQRLFRYITGDNDGGRHIAMTAPVAMSRERIAMTAPVETAAGPEGGTMRFFLPASVARAGAPKPRDPRVRIVDIPAQTVAALRFSGSVSAANVKAHEKILLDAVAASGSKPLGAPMLLGYDPPFTIPFLRRNEVAVVLNPG